MIKIYNTLTRKKEILKPIRGKRINLFVCGPTVYDFSHIGHARTYIAFDAFVKFLKWQSFKVFYLQNITDIDDKIINRAQKLKISPKNLAKRFEKEYYRDVKFLKINSVDKYAKATDYIAQIKKQIERLVKKEVAYVSTDGSVYFDISKFKDYGKLSHQKLSQLRKNVRIECNVFKKGIFDFSLWKSSKADEPFWKSPWGNGRPGWHIEDTAITEHQFGPQYDIHGGARDLIFPHHEAEIAQMEAASGKKPMVKYWMHTGFLMVNGEKMSKSLGNFITIRDFLTKHSPEVLRFIVLSAHYRSPINYTEDMAEQANSALERINEFVEKIKETKQQKKSAGKLRAKDISNFKKRFIALLGDDFNTPRALAVIFDLIKKINPLLDQEQIDKKTAQTIYDFLLEVDKIFGILSFKKKIKIPAEVRELAKKREIFRKEKKWQKADEIRKQIEEIGYKIEDVPDGPKLVKI